MIKQWQHPAGWSIAIRVENGMPPVYQQLVDQICYHVASGNLKAGEKLPTVRDLASALGINFNTVARAYHELSRSGLMVGRKGGGSSVSEKPSISGEAKKEKVRELFQRFVAEAASHGITLEELKKQLQKD